MKEVNCFRRGFGEESAEGTLLLDGQSANVVARTARCDAVEFFKSRRAYQRAQQKKMVVRAFGPFSGYVSVVSSYLRT